MFTFQIWILVQINKCISIWESVCASSQANSMFAKDLDAYSSPKRRTIHYLVMFSLASFPSLHRWRQTRLLVGWVRLSHGWRTQCPTRSVRWLARWRHPHPCRPLPPPPPRLSLHPPCRRPRPPSSAPTMWSCSLNWRSRIGKLVSPWSCSLHISRVS